MIPNLLAAAVWCDRVPYCDDPTTCENGQIDNFHKVFRALNKSGMLTPGHSIRKIEI